MSSSKGPPNLPGLSSYLSYELSPPSLTSLIKPRDIFPPVCCVVLSHSVCNPMDYRPPGSSVHGDSPGKNTGMGFHTLLQGIFPTQGSNPVLLHRRQILYHLSHQGSPFSLLPWNKYFLPVKKWNSHLLSLLFFFYLTFMKPLFVTRVWVFFFTKAHSVSAYLLREQLMELVALSV